MRSECVGENTVPNPARGGATVQCLDEARRASYEVSVQEGKLYSANGRLLNPPDYPGMFMMSPEGKIYFADADTAIPSQLHHSRFPRTGGDAADHVMQNHGSLSLTKLNQGVFYGDPIAATEDAWATAQEAGVQPVTVGNRDIYVVGRPNSGYSGGYSGQLENLDYITLITETGSNRVVTAFPSGGTPPIPKGYQWLLGN